MVTLFAKDGSDESKTFAIHEHLLCNASPFFQTAFRGDFAEEGQKSLCLRDVDYDTLNHFVPWLYSGRLSREAGQVELHSLHWIAARLNIFAITYQLSGLTEEVVALVKGYLDNLQTTDKSGALPDADQIVEIYRKSPDSNLLRKFVVQLFVVELQPSWYASGKLVAEYSQKCPGFTTDLFEELGKKTHYSEVELRTQIFDLKEKNRLVRESRDKYLQESEEVQEKLDDLEDYLAQNTDIDPKYAYR